MAQGESHDVTGEGTLPDKITALKNLAKSYDMKMRGFKLDTSNDKWVIAGKALSGSDLITQSTGIISSFAENANLMTTKPPEKFLREFADAFYRINTQILNDMSTPMENYRAVIKMFKDTMSNIGDIITGSKSSLEGIFKIERFNNPNGNDEYN